MNEHTIILYSRDGCHLCELAKSLLEKYRVRFQLTIDEFNIDGDPALREQYDNCVPVVVIDGKVRFRGIVNESLFVRLLSR